MLYSEWFKLYVLFNNLFPFHNVIVDGKLGDFCKIFLRKIFMLLNHLQFDYISILCLIISSHPAINIKFTKNSSEKFPVTTSQGSTLFSF